MSYRDLVDLRSLMTRRVRTVLVDWNTEIKSEMVSQVAPVVEDSTYSSIRDSYLDKIQPLAFPMSRSAFGIMYLSFRPISIL